MNAFVSFSGSDSDHATTDNLKQYVELVQTMNGIGGDKTDSGRSSSAASSATGKVEPKKAEAKAIAIESGVSSSSEDNVYEINICYEDSELVYFGVEKQDKSHNVSASAENALEKTSSVGSVSSMTEPFSLPTRCATITSTNSTLSSTSSLALASNAMKKTKHVVKGTLALCNFMIEHFQSVRTSLTGDATPSNATPLSSGANRGRGKLTAAISTPTSTTANNKRKRSIASSTTTTPTTPADALEIDEQKSTKKAKKR